MMCEMLFMSLKKSSTNHFTWNLHTNQSHILSRNESFFSGPFENNNQIQNQQQKIPFGFCRRLIYWKYFGISYFDEKNQIATIISNVHY